MVAATPTFKARGNGGYLFMHGLNLFCYRKVYDISHF